MSATSTSTHPSPVRCGRLLAAARRWMTVRDASSFDQHIRLASLRHAELLLVMFIAGLIAAWPVDRALFHGHPTLLAAASRWRVGMIGIDLLGLIAARLLRRLPRLAFPAIGFFGVLSAAMLGHWLAMAGAGDSAWFYASYAVPLALLPLLLPLAQRIGMTAIVTAACALGYFASGVPTSPIVGASVVTLGCVAATGVVLGHLYFRMVRSAWARQAELAVRVAERAEHVRQLIGHVEQAHADERRRIGRELHDELAQALTALRLEVSLAMRGADERVRVALQRIDRVVDDLLGAKQRLMAALRPAALEELGFARAVAIHARQVADRSGLDLELEIDADDVRADDPAAATAYRALQEALTNTCRHGAASSIVIAVVASSQMLSLEVRDDGVGFDPANTGAGSFGLIGLRERAAALGGSVDIDSAPGRGTRLSVCLPLEATAAAATAANR